MNDEDKLISLNDAMYLVTTRRLKRELAHTLKNTITKSGVRLLVLTVPFYITFSLMVNHPSIWTMCLWGGTSLFSLCLVERQLIKKIIIKFKSKQKIYFFPEETFDIDDFTKKLKQNREESFYKNSYKNYISNHKSKEQVPDKYSEALKKQQLKMSFKNPQPDVLDKEETMRKVVYELEGYQTIYKLPAVNISPIDWEMFFDQVYELFQRKNLESEFAGAMSSVLRMALARVLLYEENKITIFDFLFGISILKGSYTRADGSKATVSKKECLLLERDIATKLEKKKVIVFSPKKEESK